MGFYKIYADNYYGGIDLAEDTNERGFGFTFCCRANRPSWLFKDMLDEEKTTQPGTGLTDFACRLNEDKSIAALSWTDKNNVRYLTNLHANASQATYRRQHFSDVKELEIIPAAAFDYTKAGMGHVDTFDQHMGTCDAHHRNTCWRRTFFLTMLKMTFVNSWRFYLVQQAIKKGEQVELCQKKFLLMLREEMLMGW